MVKQEDLLEEHRTNNRNNDITRKLAFLCCYIFLPVLTVFSAKLFRKGKKDLGIYQLFKRGLSFGKRR